MRLVITGILALIILIMICAFGERNTEESRTISNPVPYESVMECPNFIPNYHFDWKNSFISSQTIENLFNLSILHK